MSRDKAILVAIIAAVSTLAAAILSPFVADWLENEGRETVGTSSPSSIPTVDDVPTAPHQEPVSIPTPSVRRVPLPEPASPPPPVQERSAPAQASKYDLDRTAVMVRLYEAGDPRGPKLFIGFRNASSSPLQYGFVSAYLMLDGVPIPISRPDGEWMTLGPAENLGGDFNIANRGMVVQAGSVIDVTYEIDIRSDGSVPTERRYERVRLTITSTAPIRMQEREILSRSTFLPE